MYNDDCGTTKTRVSLYICVGVMGSTDTTMDDDSDSETCTARYVHH